jgi:thiosulfate/3-mercaptopyruvate sulfurtransferase
MKGNLMLKDKVWITPLVMGAGLLALLALAHGAHGQECKMLDPTHCSDDSGWNALAELDAIGNTTAQQQQAAVNTNWPQVSRQKRWNMPASGFNGSSTSSKASSSGTASTEAPSNEPSPQTPARHAPEKDTASVAPVDAGVLRSSNALRMLAPISDASYYNVLLDVSDGTSVFADGAIHIDYLNFTTDNNLKSVPDLGAILGNAGISKNDSVLIYGECKPCGGGPSVATYAYCVMKYLGHDKVKVMDGTLRDWAAANETIVYQPATRPATSYEPSLNTDILASYDYVRSGDPQIVDARSFQEYREGSIPGAINIPYDSVISRDGRIKDEAALKKIFMGLSRSKPVVVYTTTGVKASMIWFTLEMVGYDARIYTWMDWREHQDKS